MNADWQTWGALGVVVVAAILLLRHFLRKRRDPGCGGCTPVDDFKKRLKRR